MYTDGSLDTFQWIRFVKLLGFRARWNKKSCKVHVHLLDSNIFGITEFSHCWIIILEYSYVTQFYVFYWHSSSLLYRFVDASSFVTCHNDVIDAGQNNQLFALGTDMDRERDTGDNVCLDLQNWWYAKNIYMNK